MSLLQLHTVSRRFGALKALTGHFIEVQPGELRAVIGLNGAARPRYST